MRELSYIVIDSFLNGYSQLASHRSCEPDDIAKVRCWLRIIRPSAVDERESEYIDHDDDLIPVLPQHRSTGSALTEKAIFGGFRWFPWGIPLLKSWFSRGAPNSVVSLRNESTVWPNKERFEKVFSIVAAIIGLFMIIGPLWVLAYIRPMEYRLAVLSGFIVVFFIVLTTIKARLYNALVAMAAYAAILVVFLQVE